MKHTFTKRRARWAKTMVAAAVMLALLVGFSLTASASADNIAWVHLEAPDVTIVGRYDNGELYLPLYIFADSYGGSIYGWSFSDGCAYVGADGLYLTAVPGKLYITANDRCFFTGQPIIDPEGVVYVPIEALARAYGLEIYYAAWGACLYGTGYDYCAPASEQYYGDEVYWLSRIINAEAGGEPFLGKMAVGNVVLNRVETPSYPDCIWGVIFDRRYGVQFTPTANGTIYRTPSDESVAAAKVCLEGYLLSDEIMFFLNPRIATSFWIVRSRVPVMSIGNHDFYA